MNTEELYDLIRSEKVVLWAGAGFSRYAGYPTGELLGRKIIKQLPVKQRGLFSSNEQLDDITERFIKLNGNKREPLYSILKKIFSKNPNSIEYHKLVSFIPHFKSIITTNYDSLFEQGYNNGINVVTNSAELKNINNSTVNLFKIHGDISHLEDIIISKSDYAQFYTHSFENVFWNTIKERITNNTIVFIGYSIEDINIKTIFQSVLTQLNYSKKHFLIAPDIPDYEIESLKTKNIQYINSTGEEFINGLIKNIKENIYYDFRAKKIGLDTLGKFLLNHNITADFLTTSNGEYIIGKVTSTDNKPKQGQLVLIPTNENIKVQFADFFTGKRFGELKIDKADASIKMSILGINYFDNDDIGEILFVSKPELDTTVDVVFDNFFSYRNLPIKIYTSNYKASIIVRHKNKVVELEAFKNTSEYKLSFNQAPPYSNAQDELSFYYLLKNFMKGEPFTVYHLNGQTNKASVVADAHLVNMADTFIKYYEMLIAIEKYYKIHFYEIEDVTSDTLKAATLLHELIENKEIFYDCDGSVFMKYEETTPLIETLKKMNETGTEELGIELLDFSVTLHGQKVIFERKVFTVYDAFVCNLDEVIKGKNEIEVMSKSNKASDLYVLKK